MATARTPFDSVGGKVGGEAGGEMRRKIIAARRRAEGRVVCHRDLAEDASMSLSTVYRHFDGKAKVIRHLAAAKRNPHGLTNQDAAPEQLRELLHPVRGKRARRPHPTPTRIPVESSP